MCSYSTFILFFAFWKNQKVFFFRLFVVSFSFRFRFVFVSFPSDAQPRRGTTAAAKVFPIPSLKSRNESINHK